MDIVVVPDSSDEEDEVANKKPMDDKYNDISAISQKAKRIADEELQNMIFNGGFESAPPKGIKGAALNIDLTLNSELLKCKELLNKYRSGGSSVTTTDEVVITAEDLARVRSKATSHKSLMNLPEVRTQPQRMAAADTFSTTAASSAAGSGGGADMMRFTTKLNGKHTWKWQIKCTDTFAKVCEHHMLRRIVKS